MSKRALQQMLVVAGVLLLTGCATHYTSGAVEEPYGFFWGIWHGLIFPLSLVVNILSWFLSLVGIDFLDSIQIIGRPNTGLGYYVGFLLGLVAEGGGAAH